MSFNRNLINQASDFSIQQKGALIKCFEHVLAEATAANKPVHEPAHKEHKAAAHKEKDAS